MKHDEIPKNVLYALIIFSTIGVITGLIVLSFGKPASAAIWILCIFIVAIHGYLQATRKASGAISFIDKLLNWPLWLIRIAVPLPGTIKGIILGFLGFNIIPGWAQELGIPKSITELCSIVVGLILVYLGATLILGIGTRRSVSLPPDDEGGDTRDTDIPHEQHPPTRRVTRSL